jgi:hypothetical protein
MTKVVAAIIAQREHQANLTILRTLSDRDLKSIQAFGAIAEFEIHLKHMSTDYLFGMLPLGENPRIAFSWSSQDGPKDETRNLEIPGSLVSLASRNDGEMLDAILPQSSVRRKRVTAIIMASSISAMSAIASYCRFSSVAPFSMMARTIRT